MSAEFGVRRHVAALDLGDMSPLWIWAACRRFGSGRHVAALDLGGMSPLWIWAACRRFGSGRHVAALDLGGMPPLWIWATCRRFGSGRHAAQKGKARTCPRTPSSPPAVSSSRHHFATNVVTYLQPIRATLVWIESNPGPAVFSKCRMIRILQERRLRPIALPIDSKRVMSYLES